MTSRGCGLRAVGPASGDAMKATFVGDGTGTSRGRWPGAGRASGELHGESAINSRRRRRRPRYTTRSRGARASTVTVPCSPRGAALDQ